MKEQLTKLEQFTLAAMQVLMTMEINGKRLNTHEIATMAAKQAQVQLTILALNETNKG